MTKPEGAWLTWGFAGGAGTGVVAAPLYCTNTGRKGDSRERVIQQVYRVPKRRGSAILPAKIRPDAEGYTVTEKGPPNSIFYKKFDSPWVEEQIDIDRSQSYARHKKNIVWE